MQGDCRSAKQNAFLSRVSLFWFRVPLKSFTPALWERGPDRKSGNSGEVTLTSDITELFFSAIVFHLCNLLHFSNMLMSTSSFEPCYKPLKHREQISNSHVMLMKLLPREVNLTILTPCRWLMTKLRLEPNTSYHTPLRSQPQAAISPDHGLLLCVIFIFLKVRAHLCMTVLN